MANLDNPTRTMLEHLFKMSGGWVLDFSDSTFNDFILTSVGVDINTKYGYAGSKARRLREFWSEEEQSTVARLNLDLLEHIETNALIAGEKISDSDHAIAEKIRASMNKLVIDNGKPNAEDVAFLEKDLGKIDLAAVPVAPSFIEVIEQRLTEIDRCIKAEAPLAVIFLCGSTLEGLLHSFADAKPRDFNTAKAAPKDSDSGQTKPFPQWGLANLIAVSRELGIIGEDVAKHADAVRDFRNYIHPRQQIKEAFNPRMHTAEIAKKVLDAAISDLAQLAP
ncbi:DUF4145 domain-containing protein [Rhodococcus fascians]|nr:DUF4145 domain-containing protein [Rhodococcus fascians]